MKRRNQNEKIDYNNYGFSDADLLAPVFSDGLYAPIDLIQGKYEQLIQALNAQLEEA